MMQNMGGVDEMPDEDDADDVRFLLYPFRYFSLRKKVMYKG